MLQKACKKFKNILNCDKLQKVSVNVHGNRQILFNFKATHKLAALNYCALNSQHCQHSILSSLCEVKPVQMHDNFAADNAASCLAARLKFINVQHKIFLSFCMCV